RSSGSRGCANRRRFPGHRPTMPARRRFKDDRPARPRRGQIIMAGMSADEDAPGTGGEVEVTALSAFARRPGVWIAVAVLLAAALLGIVQARGPLVQVAVVGRSDIEQH